MARPAAGATSRQAPARRHPFARPRAARRSVCPARSASSGRPAPAGCASQLQPRGAPGRRSSARAGRLSSAAARLGGAIAQAPRQLRGLRLGDAVGLQLLAASPPDTSPACSAWWSASRSGARARPPGRPQRQRLHPPAQLGELPLHPGRRCACLGLRAIAEQRAPAVRRVGGPAARFTAKCSRQSLLQVGQRARGGDHVAGCTARSASARGAGGPAQANAPAATSSASSARPGRAAARRRARTRLNVGSRSGERAHQQNGLPIAAAGAALGTQAPYGLV
jgi:hypothetical protein